MRFGGGPISDHGGVTRSVDSLNSDEIVPTQQVVHLERLRIDIT
jgi:hypothetical protein